VRFGTLVHAVLRDLSLAAGAAGAAGAADGLAAAHGRLLGATAEEVAAAAEAARRAAAHPLLRRAAAADELFRELPLARRLAGGSLVEGVADLLFREGEAWTLVDFKTDAPERLAALYAPQVRWYLWLLAPRPASGVVLAL
jgi:ATP-dependent exoDNAse (exonuclease V) beta subunit